jgi:hypothetical protein
MLIEEPTVWKDEVFFSLVEERAVGSLLPLVLSERRDYCETVLSKPNGRLHCVNNLTYSSQSGGIVESEKRIWGVYVTRMECGSLLDLGALMRFCYASNINQRHKEIYMLRAIEYVGRARGSSPSMIKSCGS